MPTDPVTAYTKPRTRPPADLDVVQDNAVTVSEDDGHAADDDERVWRLATALSAAASPFDVATALAEEGAAAACSSFANMAMLGQGGRHLRAVHASVLDPHIAARWTEFELTAPTPLGEAVRDRHPVLLGSIGVIEDKYPGFVADTITSGLGATASLPLLAADGTALGAVGFGWAGPQHFDPAQVRRLDLIAHMAAQSLDRALLYEREREQVSARERTEAQLLRQAFLPAVLPRTDNLELAASYLPANETPFCGDWYDAFPVDGGMFLVIGDVAGHGTQAAATMAQLRNAVRAFADEDPAPDRVLTRLNRMFSRLNAGETATAIVARWDPSTATLLRSNAGHPPVLRCRRDELAFLVPPPGGLLLGVQATSYQAEPKVLRPGTTLLFYTDGLVEMRGRSLAEGMEDLRAFVAGLEGLSPRSLCDRVVEWRLDAGRREDDMCLLAARLN